MTYYYAKLKNYSAQRMVVEWDIVQLRVQFLRIWIFVKNIEKMNDLKRKWSTEEKHSPQNFEDIPIKYLKYLRVWNDESFDITIWC